MAEEQKTAEKAAPSRKGGLGGILGVVLPAIFAAGAAFGGAKLASGAQHATKVEHAPPAKPGPTLPLDPFLVNTLDAQKGAHAMKMTLAIEFDEHTKDESLKPLVPRLRDAVLTYLRTMSYEDAADPARSEKTRSELLERIQKAGAGSAQKVLVTDLVVQQ